MKRAFLFPGQGSQTVGMGRDVAEAFPEARHVFEEVDEALKQKLSQLIFEGSQEDLTLTENAQPAIMATSIAILRVMEKESGKELPELCDAVAGHSLGEYSALCAAGSLQLAETAKLLKLRGQSMQRAVPKGQGAMAAVLGLDYEATVKIASEAADGDICQAANDNAPGQVVLSGSAVAVERAVGLARDHGAKRAVMLEVSAPFHCALMEPAAQAMQDALADAGIQAPSVPLVANVTAAGVTDPETIRKLLVEQVTGMVRWRESIEHMVENGLEQTFEIGAGKVLTGLNRRIHRELQSVCIATPDDIEAYLKNL